jgi:formylglycine-generating enzyme required for sulfatase activity
MNSWTGVRALVVTGVLAGGWAAPVRATGLRVETRGAERSAGGNTVRVAASVSWKNAWRNARNHDAVWLVVKLRSRSRAAWTHARLVRVDASGGSPGAACVVTTDRVGAFCAAAAAHRGDIAWQITLEVTPAGIPEGDLAAGAIEAQAIGLEMVHIPAGPYTLGDRDARSVEGASFYRSDARGQHGGTYRVSSEAAIRVAPEEGALYYQTRQPQYGGDRQGPVPASFPKGTRAFYVMKYEILQGQYATFLNGISSQASFFRAPMSGRGYYDERGTIRLERDRYVAASPDRPANWVSWDDGTAFADWAGLRPMTELEFTKAARGPGEPVAGDYPWGTASKERLLRRTAANDELVQAGDADEARLTDATRDVLGASYYWVMDLAGSVWEKVVTIGHPRGRAFRGTHGDGVLRDYGMATNDDWPSGDHDGGGYGYRGGGYYERGMTERDLNPFSHTEQRPYGSWGGAPRSIAYGFRAARSADAATAR